MNKPTILCLAVISIATCAQETHSVPDPANATVCGLAATPKAFIGNVVRVEAVVKSDLIHHTMLVDDACSKGVSLWIPHDLDDNKTVMALRQALRNQWTAPPESTVRAVAVGTLIREHKALFLKITAIERVTVLR